jgi:hypothetical protein
MIAISRLPGVDRLDLVGDKYRFRVALSAEPDEVWKLVYEHSIPGAPPSPVAAGQVDGPAIYFATADRNDAIRAWLAAIDHRIDATNLACVERGAGLGARGRTREHASGQRL